MTASTANRSKATSARPSSTFPTPDIKGDWETCMTMNDTWGYKSDDHHWKSTETLLRNLIDIASKGGNYLLNVGPKSDGTIPDESIERLRAMGKWMKTNGEAIYGTTASPIPHPAWGRITTKARRRHHHALPTRLRLAHRRQPPHRPNEHRPRLPSPRRPHAQIHRRQRRHRPHPPPHRQRPRPDRLRHRPHDRRATAASEPVAVDHEP